MIKRRTEYYTIKGFINNEPPIRVEGGVPVKTIIGVTFLTLACLDLFTTQVFASSTITQAYDKKIWPLMIDLGTPLAKTVMALGIYKGIRSDVDGGWKMFYRAGIGLVALFLVDGVIHIINGVGNDLSNS